MKEIEQFKISIVIPTYNREKFIQSCIDSVLDSGDENIEIIIVDNASTDKTLLKVKKYEKDPRIRVIINKNNHERSFSRNLGIRQSTGKFITLLDSDDKLNNNIFFEFRKFYNNNKKYNIYFSNFQIYNLKSKKIKNSNFRKDKCNLEMLSKGNYLSNICVFFRKSFAANIFFDENQDIIGIEDYDFNLRAIFECGEAKRFSKKNLGIVTDHVERSVNIDNVEKAEKRYNVFSKKILQHNDYLNFKRNIKFKIISTSSLYLSLICINNKNRFKSIKYLYISLINNFEIIKEKRFYYIIFKLILFI